MTRNNIFISFSSKDLLQVKKIMRGLASQEITFLDYSDEIQEIEKGDKITEKFKNKIEECDFFLAVVSQNCIDSKTGKFTRFALEYAIDQNYIEKNKIIPILLRTEEGKIPEYRDIYTFIENIKYEEFELNNIKSYLNMLRGICKRLDVLFIPSIEEHSRLPFWESFREEITEMAHSNTEHVELMSILGEFNEYFKNGDLGKAHNLISFFITYFQYIASDYEIFYPYIAKAVCEQHLGRLAEAEQTYRLAGKIRKEDKNVYGGLGSIFIQKEDYIKAEEYFYEAMEYAALNQDTNEKINYIICLIENEKQIPKRYKNFILNLDLSLFSIKDHIKIKNAKAALLHRNHDFYEALDILTEMISSQSYDTTTIRYSHNCYMQTGKNEDAKKLLLFAIEENNENFDKATGYLLLSEYYLFIGEPNKALDIYENQLLSENKSRKLFVKYASIFKHLNDESKLIKVCEEILTHKLFPLPKTREDFYYDGFIQYLSGNIEKAEYDFERSDNFDLYYSEY